MIKEVYGVYTSDLKRRLLRHYKSGRLKTLYVSGVRVYEHLFEDEERFMKNLRDVGKMRSYTIEKMITDNSKVFVTLDEKANIKTLTP